MKKLALIFIFAIVLILSLFICSFNSVEAKTKNYTVCPQGQGCTYSGGEGLQQLFRELSFKRDSQDDYKVFIENGIYGYPDSRLSTTQIWHERCGWHEYATTFLLQEAKDVVIEGESRSGAVILGEHEFGFSVVDSRNVEIKNLAIISNGGLSRNGTGDGALNLVNSTGKVYGTIIATNKTSSNQAFLNKQTYAHQVSPYCSEIDVIRESNETISHLDQEGIFLDGPETDFRIEANLIVDNIHTGIMLVNGAKAFVVGNLIMNNGWVEGGFLGKGHGVVVYHDFNEDDYCQSQGRPYYNPEVKLRAWNNIIYNNSGEGIYLRGRLGPFSEDERAMSFSHNTLSCSRRSGFQVGPTWSYLVPPYDPDHNKTVITSDAYLYIGSNLVTLNKGGGFVFEPNRVQIQSEATVQIRKNDSVGAPDFQLANYSIPDDLIPLISMGDNYELNPMRNEYFQLDEDSPLIGLGEGGSDICSYSAPNAPWAEFDVNLFKQVYEGEYRVLQENLSAMDMEDHFYYRQNYWQPLSCQDNDGICPFFKRCTPENDNDCVLEGDLDGDSDIDSQDAKILLENWGASSEVPAADLNEDEKVNGIDFGEMVKLVQE